ncbi:IMPACT family protein [Spelaeicoccus albus]|uniref:Putative YigZ family protein n=1 Tax=Spelaeicoccus albus TaxID=1280376 RepID=A0A7Z0D205_9MICO|nr:YigZ family protein [Spelaeicoccus albus]NYI67330.1 putative YigZ family protein [Spelaeicoccus albus]
MEFLRTPVALAEAEIEVKRSRFIAVVGPAQDEDAAGRRIAEQRLAHPRARHHCSAFRVADGSVERSDDDGEPAGTAGGPMLGALDGAHVVNAVAVVTRYFGGVLLGTGGLVRAYSGAVREALAAASLRDLTRLQTLTVVVDYAIAARVEAAGNPWRVLGAQYGASVTMRLGVPGDPDAARARLRDLSAGTASIELGGVTYA